MEYNIIVTLSAVLYMLFITIAGFTGLHTTNFMQWGPTCNCRR